MADRLLPAQLKTPATQKIRLADFETGKSDLRAEHRTWLEQTVHHLGPQDQFWVYIFGFASKLGQKGSGGDLEAARSFNRQLSYERASKVARYMEDMSDRVTSRIQEFSARGSDDYTAPSTDNSAAERAVEVHVYMVPAPPPPPPNVDPVPPLPGGRRFSSWAIAAPFSISSSIFPGAVAAANVVAFRCHDLRDETRTYLTPGVGPGGGWSGPGKLGKIWEMVKATFGKVAYSGMSFTDVTANTPFNFRDLEGATCQITSGGVGVFAGYQLCYVSAYGQLWYRDSNGKAMFGTKDFVTRVDCRGKDLQLGIGGSGVGGPLFRID
jgi:hypothetical protein